MKTMFDVPEFPSACETSAMETEGGESLSVIEPVPWPLRIPPFVGFERLSKKVSTSSYRESSTIETDTDFDMSPGWKVRVPDVAT